MSRVNAICNPTNLLTIPPLLQLDHIFKVEKMGLSFAGIIGKCLGGEVRGKRSIPSSFQNEKLGHFTMRGKVGENSNYLFCDLFSVFYFLELSSSFPPVLLLPYQLPHHLSHTYHSSSMISLTRVASTTHPTGCSESS